MNLALGISSNTALFILIIVIVFFVFFRRNNDEETDEMWEILVPASNKLQEFTYEHHKAWDEFVIKISGGITIMKTAKGEWISPNNVRFKDRMIPVRIKCKTEDIDEIIDFTIKHYNQEAVLAYKISEEVILKHKDELEDNG